MSRWQQEAVTVGTAVMFLTRLPVGQWSSGDPAILTRSTRYFPLVGVLVGGIVASVAVLSSGWWPVSMSILAALTVSVLLTGAFHEDGLADVADSAGAFDRERKLTIMRDSRVGTYGASALVLLFAWKLLALQSLGLMSMNLLFPALIAAHVLARWSSVWLMFRLDYARVEAANRVVASGVDARCCVQASAVTAVCLLPVVVMEPVLILLWPLSWMVCAFCSWLFLRWYGGITGDCLGAANQLVEVALLAAAVSLFSLNIAG